MSRKRTEETEEQRRVRQERSARAEQEGEKAIDEAVRRSIAKHGA